MGRDYQQATGDKRPPARKNVSSKNPAPAAAGTKPPKEKDLKKCIAYIENVRKTGDRWNRHVEKLEAKYQRNVVKIYHELVDNVKANNKKKAERRQEKAARHRKKHGGTPPTSSNGSTSSESTNSSSSSSNASGHTFSSMGVTQAMIEQQRGRPKNRPTRPSNLSQQAFSRNHMQQSQADSARFSLSDEGSSVPDIGLTTDTSFENDFNEPDPKATADFFADLPPPLARKAAPQSIKKPSVNERPDLRIKLKVNKQTKVTEASSEGEDSQWQSSVHQQLSSSSGRQPQEKSEASLPKASKVPVKSRVSPPHRDTETRPPASKRTKASAPAEQLPVNKSPQKRSLSEITISAAIEDLYSEPENGGPSKPIGSAAKKQDDLVEQRGGQESGQERPSKPISERKKRKIQPLDSVDNFETPKNVGCDPPNAPKKNIANKADRNVAPWQIYQEEYSQQDSQPTAATSRPSNDPIRNLRNGPGHNPRSDPGQGTTASNVVDSAVNKILSEPNGVANFLAQLSTTAVTPEIPMPVQPSAVQPVLVNETGPGLIVAGPVNAAYPLLVHHAHIGSSGSTLNTGEGQLVKPGNPINGLQSGLQNDPLPFQPSHLVGPHVVPDPYAANGLNGVQRIQAGHDGPLNELQQDAYMQRNTITDNDVTVAGPAAVTRQSVVNAGGHDAEALSLRDIKINEGIVQSLSDLDFTKVSDFARNGMGKEEIRLFIAAIADELKLRKPETLAAIFKVTAAVLRYQEGKTRI